MMTFFPVVLALAVMPGLPVQSAGSGATLASLRHDYRPVLVFAGWQDEEVRQQMKLLEGRAREMEERQMVVVPIVVREGEGAPAWKGILPGRDVVRLEKGEDAAARRRFHVNGGEFTVILIGKDGGEKLRSRTPVTMERLMKVIDAMPMRQKEARDGHSG